jgi:hypothetical protein
MIGLVFCTRICYHNWLGDGNNKSMNLIPEDTTLEAYRYLEVEDIQQALTYANGSV